MKFQQIFIILIIATASFASSPLFLEHSRICTLLAVGKIPAGHLQYPVYQKICRQVIPRSLGDAVLEDLKEVEDEVSTNANNNDEVSSTADRKDDELRRAILSSI